MFEVFKYDPKYHEHLLDEFFKQKVADRNKDRKSIHYDDLMENGVIVMTLYKDRIGFEACRFITEKDGTRWAKYPWRVCYPGIPYRRRSLAENIVYESIYEQGIFYIACFFNVETDYHKRVLKFMPKYFNDNEGYSTISLMYQDWQLHDREVYEMNTWSRPIYFSPDKKFFLKRDDRPIQHDVLWDPVDPN